VNRGDPMRIAVDANVLGGAWGGIPKYLSRIAAELAADGDRVDLLANTRRLERRVAGTHEVGIRVKGTNSFWRQGFLPLWLAASRPDVLWAPESVLPRRCPTPTVVTIHDLAALRFPGTKPPAHEHLFRTTVARSARRATRVIAVSRATADDVATIYGIDPGRISVVPNGVDAEFSPGDHEAALAAVSEHWGIDAPFVLHLGSLEPRKGLSVLIEAAELAASRGAKWRVALAGSGGFGSEEVVAAARRSGVCDLLGPVADEDLLALMRAADAYAAPALYEGFGIPPLEAMACGTPAVIAADSGGLEEVSGPAAIVVAERSPEAWVEGIEVALARPRELIDRGLAHAARFRWPQVSRETRAVLAAAADG
jgi:glycosyltransferase involved in cell wall biosynthesis